MYVLSCKQLKDDCIRCDMLRECDILSECDHVLSTNYNDKVQYPALPISNTNCIQCYCCGKDIHRTNHTFLQWTTSRIMTIKRNDDKNK